MKSRTLCTELSRPRRTVLDHRTVQGGDSARWCHIQDVYGRDMASPNTVEGFANQQVTKFDQPGVYAGVLYDYQAYPAAGTLQVTFFAVPQGQGATIFGAGAKTYADTNMELASTLSTGSAFRIRAIEIYCRSGVNPITDVVTGVAPVAGIDDPANDMAAMYSRGWLEFNVLGKTILRDAPLAMFNPRTVMSLQFGGSVISDVAAQTERLKGSNMVPIGAPYLITPVTLTAQLKFNCQAKWNALVPTPSTVAGVIGCRLIGDSMLAAQ